MFIKYQFLLFSHSWVPSVALNNTKLSLTVSYGLCICAHEFNLLESKFNDTQRMLTFCDWFNDFLFFCLVLDCIETNKSVFTQKDKHAISMINYFTMLVDCLKSYSFVWIRFSIYANFVPFRNKFLNYLNVRSVWDCNVKTSRSVIENHRSFSFKSFAFIFKVSEIYNMLIALRKLFDDLRLSFISSWLVFHRVKNEHTFWNSLSFVASKPVWKYWVRCIFSHLWKDSNLNSCILNIFDKSFMFSLNLGIEWFPVLVNILSHKFVV